MVVNDLVLEEEALDDPVVTFQSHPDMDNWDTTGEVKYRPIKLLDET